MVQVDRRAHCYRLGIRRMIALMREAAYARHFVLWVACGANPAMWPLHVAVITAVYGR